MYLEINPAAERNLYGFSKLDFIQLQNNQQQYRVNSLMSGLPKMNKGVFDAVSPNLLYQIYDSKAITPKVIDNYLKKVEDTFSVPEPEEQSKPEEGAYKTIVDEILEENEKSQQNESDEDPEPAPQVEEDPEAQENPDSGHFGIVGEIFDKYA